MRRIHKIIVLILAAIVLVAGSVAATAAIRRDTPQHPAVNPQSVHGSTGYVTQNENLVFTGTSNSNDPVIYSGTNHIVDTNWLATGVVQLTYDRNVGYCSIEATPYPLSGRFWYASAAGGFASHPTRITVYLWFINDNGDEAPANGYVYVNVVCSS